jgi:multidrug efflux system membrane fusion protein
MSNRTTELRRSHPIRYRSKSRIRSWLLGLVIILIGLASTWFWIISPHLGQKPRSFSRRDFMGSVMPVGVAVVAKGDLPITLRGLGTVTPLATVTVKTQINGQLMQIGFKEGQRIKKGEFLALIDPRIYEAQLVQFRGQLVRDQAQLANAKLDLGRYQKLSSQDSIAHQTLDTQLATVQQDEGIVQNDQGLVESAQVNLAYCRIESPVDGQVGLRQVDAGNYVQPSDSNGIVIITQMQPISVIFTLPEDNVWQVTRRLHDGAALTITAYDRTDTTEIAAGTLATTDNQVDTSTGTVKLRAVFPNDKEELFPNQFVNAHLLVDTLHDATLLPVAAVQHGAPGTYVYIVNSDQTVSVRTVKLGPGDDQHVSVISGVTPGETVVVDGVDKLRDGARITIPSKPGEKAAISDGTSESAGSSPGFHRHHRSPNQTVDGTSREKAGPWHGHRSSPPSGAPQPSASAP